MGIAAHNRGSANIARQIIAEQRPISARNLDDINAGVTGSSRLFEATVARYDAIRKAWFLMNKADDGWAEFGYQYPSLRAIGKEWKVQFCDLHRDVHSLAIRVIPD